MGLAQAPRSVTIPSMGKFLLVLLFEALALAQSFNAVRVDSLVQASMKAWHVPGAAVVIVHGDEVVYMKGHGVREMGSGKPVTPDTLFAIASTTKAFTTLSMAILVDEGKMAWDDPVRKHIPWFRLSDPLASDAVTMRDIVSHRTGLSRHDILWVGSPWSREEIIRRIGLVPLTKPFRSAYQYQNIMFTTAGEAVGRISGGTWEDFVRTRIFEPLGVTGADFSTTVAGKTPDHSAAHSKDSDGKVKVSSWRNVDNIGSAGCINAGVRDMSRWVRLQLSDGTFEGKRIVSKANLDETHTPQTVIRLEGVTAAMNPETNQMNYGLGWTIQDYRGRFLVSHGGSLNGFRSQVALLPKEKYGMVILSNLGGTQMPEALRNTLTDYLLGLAPNRDWDAYMIAQAKKQEDEAKAKKQERQAKHHKDTRPSRELSAYAGDYQDPAYGVVKITAENGGLFLAWSNFKCRLEHFHFDTFRITDKNPLEDTQVVFRLGPDGEVEALEALEVTFQRMKAGTMRD